MNILIIEDEAPAARRLQKRIQECDTGLSVLATLDSVASAERWLRGNAAPDLIFMDIQLADGLSFEIFGRIEVPAPVIFTTAYDEYALRAFKVNSIDYLLKPIDRDELCAALAKWRRLYRDAAAPELNPQLNALLQSLQTTPAAYKKRFLVKQGQRLISLAVDQVAYFSSEDKVVFLVDRQRGKFVLSASLDELEQQLDPDAFFRLNRQFLVAFTVIQGIQPFFNGKLKVQVVPSIEGGIVVSRERASSFKEWLDR